MIEPSQCPICYKDMSAADSLLPMLLYGNEWRLKINTNDKGSRLICADCSTRIVVHEKDGFSIEWLDSPDA